MCAFRPERLQPLSGLQLAQGTKGSNADPRFRLQSPTYRGLDSSHRGQSFVHRTFHVRIPNVPPVLRTSKRPWLDTPAVGRPLTGRRCGTSPLARPSRGTVETTLR